MLRSITLSLACSCGVQLFSQVELDRPLVLSSPNDADRQVIGLPAATSADAVLTATVARSNAFRASSPEPGELWAVSFEALSGTPPAGTHLIITAPPNSSGEVQLVVNGSGPYPLLTGPNTPLLGEDVPSGTMLSVVMDGVSFHVLNGHVKPRRPCPSGTVEVNQEFCIEPNERVATDFFTAIDTCNALGSRLCGWSEFLIACQRATELGLVQPTNSWEWTNDASNENNCARIVGAGSCLSAGNALVSGSLNREYRCCYSR
jgi:hypothetical protein